MEVILVLSCALTTLITTNVGGAAIDTPLHVITLDDLPQHDQSYLTYLEHETIRQKRADDLLGLIKEKISKGIHSKIAHVASASGHLSSHKGHHPHDNHDHHDHHEEEEKMFDFWDLQKSILHTLLQAVKAIKGGLIAIKGQLIKGGGYIVSAKGKLLTAKGEAITNIGKHIASSANLSPHPSHHSGHSGHSGPEIIYGGPPSGGYGAPSGHGIELHVPHHGHTSHGYSEHHHPTGFDEFKDHLAKGAQHGILILKKIPKGHKDKHNGNDGTHSPPETHKPDSEPEEHPVKPFKFLPDIKSIFSASHHHHEPSPPHHESPPQHYEPKPHHHESPPQHYEPKPLHHEPPHHQFESFHQEHSVAPHQPINNHYESLLDQYKPQPLNYETKPAHFSSSGAPSATGHGSEQATSYGTPVVAKENNYAQYLKDFEGAFSKMKQNTYIDHLKPDLPLPGENHSPPQGHNGLYATAGSMPYPQKLSNDESSLIPDFSNFPSYPVELSSNFHRRKISSRKAKAVPMYAVHEKQSRGLSDSKNSASELKVMLASPFSSNPPNIPTFMILNPASLSHFTQAQSSFETKQPSYTDSVSRQKRQKNGDLVRFLASRLGQYGSAE